MHRALPGLVADLEIRAGMVLDSLPLAADPPRDARLAELRMRVTAIRSEAQHLLGSPLNDPNAASGHLATYGKLTKELLQCEQFDLPFLTRWSDADRLMTEMCSALLRAIAWPYRLPLVGTFSTDYYWVNPYKSVICVPTNEEVRLLALGDLCHELGHIAFYKDGPQLRRDIFRRLLNYVQQQSAAPPGDLEADDPAAFFSEVFVSWRQWVQEFVSDLFATFLVGPAFGWQHLRLYCIQDSAAPLHEPVLGGEHPADEARMLAVLLILRRMGYGQEADEIESQWRAAAKAYGSSPASDFEFAYPEELLERLAENVDTGCRALGLRPYAPGAGECDVAVLANEAWVQLGRDPGGYGEWEAAALTRCRARWAA